MNQALVDHEVVALFFPVATVDAGKVFAVDVDAVAGEVNALGRNVKALGLDFLAQLGAQGIVQTHRSSPAHRGHRDALLRVG